MKKFLILMLLFLARQMPAQTTYYMAASGGSDSNPCSTTQRCSTFAHLWTVMHGGDTLVLGDGVYQQQLHNPPNGTGSGATAYTTVRAEHDWAVTVYYPGAQYNTALYLYQSSHIIIQGIKFRGNASTGNTDTGVVSIWGDHIKVIRSAIYDASCGGNTISGAGGPGTTTDGSDYILFEDVHVWGCGRYILNAGYSSHIIFRRVVARWEYNDCNPGSYQRWQNAALNTYNADNVVLENVILIDSGQWDGSGNITCGPIVGGAIYGGGWNENHGDTGIHLWGDGTMPALENSFTVLGNILLNIHAMVNDPNTGATDTAGIWSRMKMSGTSTLNTERNNVYWDSEAGAVYGIRADGGCTANCGAPSVDIQNNTVGSIRGTNYTSGWDTLTRGVGVINVCADPGGVCTSSIPSPYWTAFNMQNTLLMNNQSYGNDGVPGDYNAYYGNGTNYLNASPGAHDRTSNPGILYLPRVEINSPLHGAGLGGADIGANVLTKIGMDGTLWGETGYLTDTLQPLWPYPYESIIKSDFSSYTCPDSHCRLGGSSSGAVLNPPATRGFVAPETVPSQAGAMGCQPVGSGSALTPTQTSCPGKLYGGSRTLTSYIWEYLGNPCPASICNYAGPACTGNNLCVGAGQSYTTIQSCANVATAGQYCLVFPGNYAGFHSVNSGTSGNSITFCATSTGNSCLTSLNNGVIVDGNLGYGGASRGDVIIVYQNYVTVQGFTVRNSGTGGISSCLRADPSNNVTFSWNDATSGCHQWGIFTTFANTGLLIEHNRLGNVAVQHGIYVSNSDTANDSPVVRYNESFGNAINGLQFNGDCTTTNNGVTDGIISNAQVYGNYFHDNTGKGLSAIALQSSSIHDNIFSHDGPGAAAEIHFALQSPCTQESSNNTVVNNSVYCPLIACIRNTNGTGNIAFNNILVGPQIFVNESAETFYFDSGSNLQTASTVGIWTVPPVNSTPSGGDFHLLAGSPAIGIGIASYQGAFAPSTDYSGAARPTAGRYDSGAYQYPLSTATTPTFSPTVPYSGSTVTVTLTASGSIILYTLDGSSPTHGSNCAATGTTLLYSFPFLVKTSVTVSAIGCLNGATDSPIAIGQFTISPAPALPMLAKRLN